MIRVSYLIAYVVSICLIRIYLTCWLKTEKVKWIECEWLSELVFLRHHRVGLTKSHAVNSHTANNLTVFVDAHLNAIPICARFYSSRLLSTVKERIPTTTEKTFIANYLLINSCWVKGISHENYLANITISIFRWCVRCYTDQRIETCEVISRQNMRPQARLCLRRNS